MTLIAGLGNPGPKYENTRHNIGFMLIDLLKDSNFKDVSSAKFQGEVFKFNDIILLKPTTFMNLSGQSVKVVKDFYKPDRIIVIHDDLDLSFGAVKFKKGGSSGGHNGIKSIDGLIGNDYERVRVGIGHLGDAKNFVLGEFSDEEKKALDEILAYTKNAVCELLKSDINEISQKFTIKKRSYQMKLYARYVGWVYIKSFLIVFLALELFYVGIDLLTNLKDLPPSANLQLLYVGLTSLSAISYVLPLSLIFALIILHVNMVRSNELISFYALGISKNKLILPPFLIALFVTIFYVGLNFTPFAYAHDYQKKHLLKNTAFSKSTNDSFLKFEGKFIYIKELNSAKQRAMM